MVGRTNCGIGNGGLSSNDAVIHVTVMAGDSITLSKSGLIVETLDSTKSHINNVDNTYADFYYPVKQSNYGDWTITSVGNTISKTITIDTNNTYDVDVAAMYLYNYGTYTTLYSSSNVTSGATVTERDRSIYIRTNKSAVGDGYKRWNLVDLTHFNTITVERASYAASSLQNKHCVIFISQSTSINNSRKATIVRDAILNTAEGVKTTISLDVSSVTGLWYVLVGINTGGSNWANYRGEDIYSVKLT